MTAEEKLKELYERLDPHPFGMGVVTRNKVGLLPEDIDLIANLVVERLKESNKVGS